MSIDHDDVVSWLCQCAQWCEDNGLDDHAASLNRISEKIENIDPSVLEAQRLRPYKNKRHEKFAEDCEYAGLEVYHYSGRGGYSGPAVNSKDRTGQEVFRATSVPCRTDSMGMGIVVYPG